MQGTRRVELQWTRLVIAALCCPMLRRIGIKVCFSQRYWKSENGVPHFQGELPRISCSGKDRVGFSYYGSWCDR
jgi:hypothetical protein